MPATQKPAVDTTMAVFRDGKNVIGTGLGAFELSRRRRRVDVRVERGAGGAAGRRRVPDDLTVRDVASGSSRTTAVPVTLVGP